MGMVVCDIAMSVDGYVSGVGQAADAPFGHETRERFHRWMIDRPEANRAAIDRITAATAYVMGRNMFDPGRGEWDLGWTGWWGEDPPYHAPVFVLTHFEREPVPMQGGTTFHFVTDGIESALAQARAAAGAGDVAICGGAATINQYLAAGLIDELRLHVAPFVLGAGERLFEGVADVDLEQVSAEEGELVTHLTYHPVRRA
jgi:dihydrofolate reductase